MRKLLLLLAFTALCVPLAASAQSATPSFPFIYRGSSGGFQFNLLANGVPYTGTFTPTVTWTCSDSSVTITQDTAQGASSPSSTLALVSVPANDTSTSITLTATATGPDGTAVTATYVVPILSEPVAYTATITQYKALN